MKIKLIHIIIIKWAIFSQLTLYRPLFILFSERLGKKRKNFFVLGVFNLTPKPKSVGAHKNKKKCKVK
jgi:hypothetical protein